MANKGTLITAIVSMACVILFLFLIKCPKKLRELANYKVTSNTGSVVPAKLYSRFVQSTVNGKNKRIKELILSFDDNIVSDKANISGDKKLYKYLLIIPEFKMIGLVDHAGSLVEKEHYLCQYDDKANNFTSIINNKFFFAAPPVTKADFKNSVVVFNTYGILKKFGDSIIVETEGVEER